jgi:phage head maturation protease
MSPVGIAVAIGVVDDKLAARIRFADVGVSQRADEVRALVKSGVIRGISIGFDAIEGEPIDKARPRGGQRFTKVELLECSFVSVQPSATTRAPLAIWRCLPRCRRRRRPLLHEPRRGFHRDEVATGSSVMRRRCICF